MRLLAKHWRIIAKALRFAQDICGENDAQEILDLIGERGEKAVTPDQELSEDENP